MPLDLSSFDKAVKRPRWRTYRDMRARTSHTYDEDVALQVVAGIPAFLDEAAHLLAQIAQRQT